jgi:hypothetical protein
MVWSNPNKVDLAVTSKFSLRKQEILETSVKQPLMESTVLFLLKQFSIYITSNSSRVYSVELRKIDFDALI